MSIGKKRFTIDKRVDKLLLKNDIVSSKIYYSPISIWLLFLVLFAMQLIPFIYSFLIIYFLLLIPYGLTSYLLSAKLNNSFVITENQLVVINPNIPFRQFKVIPMETITEIVIDESSNPLYYIFFILATNFVTIKTADKSETFFCIGLERDAFDENLTEDTLESFNDHLVRKGIQVQFKLD